MRNPYETLGIPVTATKEEIRKAYKKLAGKCHPDKNKGDPEATKRFQEVADAYSLLYDDKKREYFDETGEVRETGPSIRNRALDVISGIYLDLACNGKYKPDNYLEMAVREIQNKYRECRSSEVSIQDDYNKLSYLIENTEADEDFIELVKCRLGSIGEQKEHAVTAVAILAQALEILDGYKYTGKTRPPKDNPFMSKFNFTDPYVS